MIPAGRRGARCGRQLRSAPLGRENRSAKKLVTLSSMNSAKFHERFRELPPAPPTSPGTSFSRRASDDKRERRVIAVRARSPGIPISQPDATVADSTKPSILRRPPERDEPQPRSAQQGGVEIGIPSERFVARSQPSAPSRLTHAVRPACRMARRAARGDPEPNPISPRRCSVETREVDRALRAPRAPDRGCRRSRTCTTEKPA